jgi:hypothetical protein
MTENEANSNPYTPLMLRAGLTGYRPTTITERNTNALGIKTRSV